jgi:hypothetical protein
MDVLVAGLLGISGVVVGAVITHLLGRSRWEREISLEERKVWAEHRYRAYTRFRELATARDSADSSEEESLDAEMRSLYYEIQMIGHPEVIRAAGNLRDAYSSAQAHPGELILAEQARALTYAVREYIDATRAALEMDAIDWE